MSVADSNRNKMLKAYLAHPFSMKDWGFEFTKRLNSIGIEVIDPFVRSVQKSLDKVVEKKAEFTDEQARDIVEVDMIKVRTADIVIGVVESEKNFSKGTHMEVISASFWMHMPVFVLYLQPGPIHPWYRYLTKSFRTETELFEALKSFMVSDHYKDWGL